MRRQGLWPLHRVAQLAARYPSLLSVGVRDTMFDLPCDVRQITSLDLIGAGALDGSQWLIVAGWPCQDLSAAGTAAGLEGPRSCTFFDMVHLVAAL